VRKSKLAGGFFVEGENRRPKKSNNGVVQRLGKVVQTSQIILAQTKINVKKNKNALGSVESVLILIAYSFFKWTD